MRRSSFLTVEQLRVGAVVLVTLVILGYGGYRLGQQAHLFSNRYQLVAFVSNASGLRPGGSVTVAGQLVGTVRDVAFLPVDADTTRNLRLVLDVDAGVREQIRGDSRARLRTQGLLGDKVFDISPGTPRYAALRDRDTIAIAPRSTTTRSSSRPRARWATSSGSRATCGSCRAGSRAARAPWDSS
jgi:phospholipid/cholesterol/gamma-HCH transport system substrate-binding protein